MDGTHTTVTYSKSIVDETPTTSINGKSIDAGTHPMILYESIVDGTHTMEEWCLPVVCCAHTMMG